MILEKAVSECEKYPKQVVSRDKGSVCKHVAVNPEQKFALRQYQLDGKLVNQKLCCDYLLLNDSTKKAYFIELKGSDVRHGIKQLEETGKYMRPELLSFTFYYRLVSRKVNTHDIKSSEFRRFKEKYFRYFKHQNEIIEETLD